MRGFFWPLLTKRLIMADGRLGGDCHSVPVHYFEHWREDTGDTTPLDQAASRQRRASLLISGAFLMDFSSCFRGPRRTPSYLYQDFQTAGLQNTEKSGYALCLKSWPPSSGCGSRESGLLCVYDRDSFQTRFQILQDDVCSPIYEATQRSYGTSNSM